MRLSKIFALVVVVGSAGVGTLGTVACGSDTGSGGSGGGTNTSTGDECAVDCDANKGIASDCVAITDNSAETKFGLRMSQIVINKPDKLTSEKNALIGGLIDDGVTMNLGDACNLKGSGTFSWLLQFDTATQKLITGGAIPTTDPTAGYCFVNQMLDTTQVAPITVDAPIDADGKFSVTKGDKVVVPIFVGTVDTFVLLPLRDAKITNAQISADNNCIGKYNSDTLKTADGCQPTADVSRYTNGGSIDAYITLEDADATVITSTKASLCVLLTGDTDGAKPAHCKRDANGKLIAKGDWCDATNSAGGCQDSFQLGADFAASAVKITGDCK